MRKLVALILVSLLSFSYAQAGILKGKKFYAEHLHEACGFTGDVMGAKYTIAEWKQFYSNETLAQVIKKECPRSQIITNRSDLRSLAAFLVTFAKDSGNKAACGG